ncbi:MAG: hypothetical protein IKJ95_08910 [Bacteroidaceae bacterium]|nr:hypothetical protein [Bacteroidaceae bacterium]
MKTIQLTLKYYCEGEGEPFDVDCRITNKEYKQLTQLIKEYCEQEFPDGEEHVEGGMFTDEFFCEKAPELYDKLYGFACERIAEELYEQGVDEDEILDDVIKSFEISNDFIDGILHPEAAENGNSLIEYIQTRLKDSKLNKDLQQVVYNPDELMPKNQRDFAELEKFGLYPAEECQPFVTDQNTPYYILDNMALVPINEPKENWMHYGDFYFRQLEILFVMARMNSAEAHEWLRDNLYMGNMKRDKCYGRVDALKKIEYKSKFRGHERMFWKLMQVEWMKYCLCLKYRDIAAFREVLHSTSKLPVEDGTGKNYPSRLFWGAELVEVGGRKYYFGCNILGKLLAQLRANNGRLEYFLFSSMELFGKPILEI